MSNIININFSGGSEIPIISENKQDESKILELSEVESLKMQNRLLAESAKRYEDELGDFRYQMALIITSLCLKHGGSLETDKTIDQFVLTNPNKVTLKIDTLENGTRYIARMLESDIESEVENNAN